MESAMDRKKEKDKRLLAAEAVLLILAAVALGVLGENASPISWLLRPEAGEGSREVELKVTVDGTGQSWNWKGTVAARVYTAKELERNLSLAEEYVRTHLPREGESLEAVTTGVNLVKEVPDTGVSVDWSWEEDELLDQDGKVQNQGLKESVLLVLTAGLHCQDVTEYVQIPVRLLPEQLSDEELFRRSLEAELERLSGERQEEERMELPPVWADCFLHFTKQGQNRIWMIPLAILIFLLFREAHKKEEQKQEQKRRQEELIRLYPDFVGRFVLLLGAGMNLYGVWQKLAEEYAARREKGGKQEFLYEQAAGVVREIRNGGLERKVYEEFGRRLALTPYLRFSSILVQNLKMGSDQILERLEYEAGEALEERKALVKKQGEEMGTKLLFPMMVQLVLILALVMIPAFMSM